MSSISKEAKTHNKKRRVKRKKRKLVLVYIFAVKMSFFLKKHAIIFKALHCL